MGIYLIRSYLLAIYTYGHLENHILMRILLFKMNELFN